MSEYHWIDQNIPNFPDPREADSEGIVAVGGDLSVATLLTAYQQGIFPWYNDHQPILWWCPDPRFVLYPDDLKVSKSMRPFFNQKKYTVSFDTAFPSVMTACRAIRRQGQPGGSWITDDMIIGYTDLHDAGYAHSVEVWEDNVLVGGLYGVALGKMFFGESMFTLRPNASKMGFITLVQSLKKRGYQLIDCQQETGHLASLGAQSIKRTEFLDKLKDLVHLPSDRGPWTDWINDTTD
jgi:leucyl/phenylalanyl-tRNA--protein transferase